MPIARCAWLVPILLAAAAGTAGAQAPTLPSDTLEARFAPPSRSGPIPELAPSLPSDTLKAQFAPAPRSGPSPELAPSLPSDTLDVTPAPAQPDGAFMEDPEENPMPARIVGMRLA
jgi:hypothetical protein